MNVLHTQRTWHDGNGTTFSHSASSDKIFQSLTPGQRREIEQHFEDNPPADGYCKYSVPLPQGRVFSCNIQARTVNAAGPIPQKVCTLNKVQVK